MTSKLFSIYGSSKLSKELQSRVYSKLKEGTHSKKDLDKALNNRSKNLGRLSFLRLHILHREFTGKEIKAIRFFVTSARYANQSIERLKTRLGRQR